MISWVVRLVGHTQARPLGPVGPEWPFKGMVGLWGIKCHHSSSWTRIWSQEVGKNSFHVFPGPGRVHLGGPVGIDWIGLDYQLNIWLNSYLKRGIFRSFTDFWSNQIRDFHNRKKVVLGFTARCSCVKWNWRNLYFAHFMIYLKPMKSRAKLSCWE